MKIDYPKIRHLPQLWRLWKEVFLDTDAFLNGFFSAGFSPLRCRCVLVEDTVAAALYWFDCSCDGQKLAYLYAVATHPDHRGKGLCRALMEDTHVLLAPKGYSGILLVPETDALRQMYASMGYQQGTANAELVCTAGADPVPLHAIDFQDYALSRRKLLPPGSVIQECENLSFLSQFAQFYKGLDFLLAACPEGEIFHGLELLGDAEAAPGILRTLGYSQGIFRVPGMKQPFSMFLPLKQDAKCPEYFAFAFD